MSGASVSSAVEEKKEDPRQKQGRKLLAEGNYEAAIEFFSALLQDMVSKFGEQAFETAPAWFEYGRALLLKEQENPSDDLLGAVAAEAKKQAQSLGDQLLGGVSSGSNEEDVGKAEVVDEDEEEEEEEEEEREEIAQCQSSGKDSGDADDEGDVTDMEIAWEALEMSRKLFEEEQDAAYDLTLSEVYECLGDVSKFNGNFSDAISEYTKCLKLRESVCQPSDRMLAQSYYTLAVAHVYWAGEEACSDKLMQKKRALKNYQSAKKVLLADEKSSGEESSEKEREERKELSEEIEETIVALKDEIVKESLGLNSSHLTSSVGNSTTTIGFGTTTTSSSSSSSSSSTSSTVSVSGAGTGAAAPARLETKKKAEAVSSSCGKRSSAEVDIEEQNIAKKGKST